MAIEVPVNDYFQSKCFYCGYGFHALCKIETYPNPFPDSTPDIVMCNRLTKECKFTPVIKME